MSKARLFLIFLVIDLTIVISVGYYFFQNPHQLATLQQDSQTLTDAVRSSQLPAEPTLATGQPADPRITLPEGFEMSIFNDQTPAARDLQFSPGGTLLVSLRDDGKVVALPDQNHDGQADSTEEVLTHLEHPHGVAFYNGKLFVAEEKQLVRYTWDEATLTARFDKKLLGTSAETLPEEGGRHITRSILFDKKGYLYFSAGSTCNVCEEENTWAGSVIITNENGDNPRIFSTGLRNAVFLTTHPETDDIWVTDMGRDGLGDTLPADEINILQDGGHYGWPYCYEDRVFDLNFNKKTAAFCDTTLPPTFKLPAHVAPLGLMFVPQHRLLPEELHGDLLVAEHGSGSLSLGAGYKVVRLHVENNTVTSQSDFITGFLQGRKVLGRPVDLTADNYGNLYLSDDYSGVIYLIHTTNPPATH